MGTAGRGRVVAGGENECAFLGWARSSECLEQSVWFVIK